MRPHSNTILVTGGCGFMGSHFVRHIYNKYPKYKIVNLDLLTYAGNIDNLNDIEKKELKISKNKKRYFFIKGDIGKKLSINSLFAYHRPNKVIHFAAESHVDRSIMSSVQFMKTNVLGTQILVEAARRHKTSCFIHISTDEVYGDIPKTAICNESYPLQPTNPYAASKAAADLLVQSYIKTHKFPAIIVRSSNNYGTYQYPEKLHPLIITNILLGKRIPIHGSGQHIRSWLHVQDFCNAVDLIMHTGEKFSIYNLSGEEKSTIEVAKSICNILKVDYKKYVLKGKDRHGADFRYSPNFTRISKELGWKRQFHYNKALNDIVFWYQNNVTWWKKIRKRKEFLRYYGMQISGHYTFEADKI